MSAYAAIRNASAAPVVHVARFRAQGSAAADIVMGAQAEPRCKRRSATKFREIRPNFGQNGVSGQNADAGNLGWIYTEDSVEVTSQIKTRFITEQPLAADFRRRQRLPHPDRGEIQTP